MAWIHFKDGKLLFSYPGGWNDTFVPVTGTQFRHVPKKKDELPASGFWERPERSIDSALAKNRAGPEGLVPRSGPTRASNGLPEHSRRAAHTVRYPFVAAESGRADIRCSTLKKKLVSLHVVRQRTAMALLQFDST